MAKKKKATKKTRDKAGAPTKYKKEYCKRLIEHGEKGLSFRAFCASIRIHWDTGYLWAKTHKEFSDAKKIHSSLFYSKWEQIGMKAASGNLKGMNTGAFAMIMKNCFDWSDNPNHEPDPVDDVEFTE